MKAPTKKERIRAAVLEILREHAADPDGLPTTLRFIFYEMEQRGLARKPTPDRAGRRRTVGWPPGSQDITDVVARMREDGDIPWDWFVDTERSAAIWLHAPTALGYLENRLDEVRINPWSGPPPLILTESNGMAEALDNIAARYVCPIAGTKGMAGGFLWTRIAPLLKGNDRVVLYLGDRDRSGHDIEANTWSVLERAADRDIEWTRIGLTEEQTEGIEPIWKVDGRDGRGHYAWEVESLGQSAVVSVVRSALDALLPEPLASVLERERAETEAMGEYLRAFRNGAG
jgi:hypothetical protein